MFQNVRQAMTWLHTWFGLVLGYVLIIVFFFGALSVFDREIDRWAMPETRFEPQAVPSFDRVLRPVFERMQMNADERALAQGMSREPLPETLPFHEWGVYATHRDPVMRIWAGFELPAPIDPAHDHAYALGHLDPRTGKPVSSDRLPIGSEFFYPLHYGLHLHWKDIGYWVVALAALTMLVALVSGVVMHRKIFREFFTFRPKKSLQRSTLDLHNMTGVLGLPFHLVFALSGLVIFARIYFPVSDTVLKDESAAALTAQMTEAGMAEEAAGVAAPLASVDAMVAEARQRWQAAGKAGEVGMVTVHHVGDVNAVVSVYRAGTDRVTLVSDGIHFKGPSGELIREDPPPTAVAGINDFLTGLHLQHFRHWLLRWLYVLGGLLGCVCIATGFIFFVEKRKRQHARQGSQAIRWVDALAVGAVTGMLVATVTMLVANRLLPADLPMRGLWEERVFWGAWVLAILHAFVRGAPVAEGRLLPAWREQCWLVAVLSVMAVCLNWLTTGDHLLKTIGHYWPVAGVDLCLLACAGVCGLAARHLRQRENLGIACTQQQHGAGEGGVGWLS